MALFGKKKEEKKEKGKDEAPKKDVAKKTTAKKSDPVPVSSGDRSWVLRKPRMTEKATITPEVSNAYVFDIDPRATKTDVKEAVKEIYKVSPTKVNITKVPKKSVERRRARSVKKGFRAGGKKAYIYLKKGDKIEFV